MATTTKRKTPSKKKAATPAAEPATSTGPRDVRTDVSSTGPGTEDPAPGSASTVGGIPRAEPATDEGLEEAIARRAYEIYEASGRPAGRQQEHWQRAEREIRAERGRLERVGRP